MNDESQEKKLLELGRELSEQLLRRPDRRDSEALVRARRRALHAAAQPARATLRSGTWLAAAAVTGVAAFAMVMTLRLWDGSPMQNDSDEPGAFLAKNVTADDAPWNENLDMLQNMDFSLWLDMAGPDDAG